MAIAAAFNQAVNDGRLHGPVNISRDHHDVSGTDSPFRETSNIYDGSAFCAGKMDTSFNCNSAQTLYLDFMPFCTEMLHPKMLHLGANFWGFSSGLF